MMGHTPAPSIFRRWIPMSSVNSLLYRCRSTRSTMAVWFPTQLSRLHRRLSPGHSIIRGLSCRLATRLVGEVGGWRSQWRVGDRARVPSLSLYHLLVEETAACVIV